MYHLRHLCHISTQLTHALHDRDKDENWAVGPDMKIVNLSPEEEAEEHMAEEARLAHVVG